MADMADLADMAQFSEEPKAAVQQVLQIHFISLAGTQKGCLQCFNGLVS